MLVSRFNLFIALLSGMVSVANAVEYVHLPDVAMPTDAQEISPGISGRIELTATNVSLFDVHVDEFGYDRKGSHVRQFPGLQLELKQSGFDLLASPAGIIDSGHPAWEIAVQPGNAWEDPDGQHAVLPFALLERNANCTHNGLLWWTPGETVAQFQISSETCAYFKFDMRGSTTIRRIESRGFPEILDTAIARNREARLPVTPVESISDDYAALSPAAFGAVGDMSADDMTVYGVVIDGKHYRSECRTRHGLYPYCDDLLLPSYSTAKSFVAGVALMHLERLHDGAADLAVSDWISACSDWDDVRLEDALDMATGRYNDSGFQADEASSGHVDFLYAPTHERRISAACKLFRKRESPGQRFVYHSSDTYIVGTAIQNLLRHHYGEDADLFRDLLERPIFAPLAFSPVARQTRRSYDTQAQPLSGWGLTLIPDDFARIGNWLNAGQAKIGRHTLLDSAMYDATMQKNPEDRGLEAGGEKFRYNNGFWAHDIADYIGCDQPVWVPSMAGYGGISVILFPNGITYYYVSDGRIQRWREAAVAANAHRTMCP